MLARTVSNPIGQTTKWLILAVIGLISLAAIVLAPPVQASPGINQTINFQGKVTNADGTNVTDGTYDFVFKMYNGAGSGASTLFTETWSSASLFSSTMSSAPASGGEFLVYDSDTNEATLKTGQILWNTTKKESVKIVAVDTVNNSIGISPTRQAWATTDTITNRIYVKSGLFTASINSLNKDLSGVDFNSDSIYLGINFSDDGEMKPRIQYSAVPYAFNSQKVNGVTVTNTSGGTPTTGTTIKIADGKTVAFNGGLTFAGTDGKTLTVNNTLTFTGTDSSTVNFGSGGTVCYTATCQNQPGITWTAQSATEANPWRSVVFGNGIFVAIASTGTNQVMTSPDGVNWTAQSAAEANSWQSVTYGNGIFVAVANTGTNRVMTSPDGVNWTAQSAAEANTWTSVTYGNGLFVAVAQAGINQVMTSPDGVTWTAHAATEANWWYGVTYGNGLFVAVSRTGTNRVMTSTDGANWAAQSAAEANSWYTITYGNGLFVAVALTGTHRVMTSPDGVSWTGRMAAEANWWYGVTYGNGLFVAVGDNGTNNVMTSTDGINWTARTAEANWWISVAYGNGMFVAVAESGTHRVITSGIPTQTITPTNNIFQGGLTIRGGLTSATINGLAIAASTGTLSIANGKTLTASNTLTFTGTDSSTVNFGAGGTVCYVGNCTGASVADDSLDFDKLSDAMTLDASTDIALAGHTLSTSGTGALSFANTGGVSISGGNLTVAADKTIKLTGGTAFPGSPAEGDIFFRTDSKQLYIYANSKWQADRSTASKIVAASDSQNKEKADYVADGTNDEAEIETAIGALPSGGGMVVLLEGSYSIGSDITITKSNTKLIGAGTSTILNRAFDESTARTSGVITVGDGGTNSYSNISLSSFKINGVKATYTNANNHGILFKKKISNSAIQDVTVTNGAGDGIRLTGYATSGNGNNFNTIDRNELTSNTGDGIHLDYFNNYNSISNNRAISNTVGIDLDGYNANNRVEGNLASSNSNNGITVYYNATNTVVSGNSVFSSGGRGIYVDDADSTTVSGNVVKDTSSASIHVDTSNNVAVTGNTIEGGGPGILLYLSEMSNITGNTITASSGHGIDLYISDGNVVSSNKIHNSGGSGNSSGIKIEGTSANNTVTGNDITDTAGTGSAIQITSDSPNNVLTGNRFSGTGATSISDSATTTIYNAQQYGSSDLILKPQGNVGLGLTNPSALLHLAAGTATKAPLKFTAGTNLTTPEGGAVEFDGSRLYVTNSSNQRKTLAFSDDVVTLADDSLDFDKFADSMALDAATSINLGANQLTFNGTSGINFANTGSNSFAGIIVIGSGGNTITLDASTGITFAGTARRDKTLRISPEYPNSTQSWDGTPPSNGGVMTTENELNGGTNKWMNYYNYLGITGTLADRSVLVRVDLPPDFDSWQTGSCPGSACALEFSYKTGTSSTSDNAISVKVNNNDDTPGTVICTISDVASLTWAQVGCDATTLSPGSSPSWDDVANPTAILRIKLKGKNTVGAYARIGDIVLRYKSKY